LISLGARFFLGEYRVVFAVNVTSLIQQLRQMETDGIVRRIVHHQVPPKVEYGLTD
jgi:DNA-binding HxlR family transcriptional regulator